MSKNRKLSFQQSLARLRKGDVILRRDYAGAEFKSDGTRVAPATVRELIDSGDMLEAPPHIGAEYPNITPQPRKEDQ